MKIQIILMALFLGGCDQIYGATEEYHYSVEEDGAADRDVNEYRSLGEKSVTITQSYILKLESPARSESHFAVANIDQFYGDKRDNSVEGVSIFIDDGRGEFECSKYLSSLPLDARVDELPALSCKIEVLGYIPLAGGKLLASAETGT